MRRTVRCNIVPHDAKQMIVTTRLPEIERTELRLIDSKRDHHRYLIGTVSILQDGSAKDNWKTHLALDRQELAALRDAIDAMLGEEDPWHKS